MIKLFYTTERWVVRCPRDNALTSAGFCADCCDNYEGDGQDIEYMLCSYEGER